MSLRCAYGRGTPCGETEESFLLFPYPLQQSVGRSARYWSGLETYYTRPYPYTHPHIADDTRTGQGQSKGVSVLILCIDARTSLIPTQTDPEKGVPLHTPHALDRSTDRSLGFIFKICRLQHTRSAITLGGNSTTPT